MNPVQPNISVGNFSRYVVHGLTTCLCLVAGLLYSADSMPISPLWQSDSFRKAYTASYGIDSKIEPLINEDESFYLNEAAKLMAEGDRPAAIQKIKDSDIVEESPALLFSLGNFYYEEGEPKVSISYFEEALKLFPNFRDAHRNVAMLKIQEGDADAGETHLKRAIELGSQEGLTYGLLAYCHTQKNRLQAALSAYRMAQVTMPEEIQWQLGEAFTLQSLGEAGKASSIYANLIKKNPADQMLWINQANAFNQKKDQISAIAHLEMANRMGDLDPRNRIILGQMLLQQSVADKALLNFEKSIEKKGIDVKTAVASLNMLVSYRFWDEVLTFGKKCSATYKKELADSSNKEIRSSFDRGMALAELETGSEDAAAKRIEKLIEADPLDGDALLLLAKFREERNQDEDAILLLEQAAGISDKRAKALLAHGRILVKQFRYKEALERLQESQSLSPSDWLKTYIAALEEFL